MNKNYFNKEEIEFLLRFTLRAKDLVIMGLDLPIKSLESKMINLLISKLLILKKKANEDHEL